MSKDRRSSTKRSTKRNKDRRRLTRRLGRRLRSNRSNRSNRLKRSRIKKLNIKAGLPNYKKIAKEYKIKDVPFADSKHKGTKASCASVDYHYQNYSNVMDFLLNIKGNNNLYFFRRAHAFLSIDIDKLKSGIKTHASSKIFSIELKNGLKSNKKFIPIILNIITEEGNHANILLVDKENNNIELYEPHGARVSSSVLGGVIGAYRKKIKMLRDYFHKILPKFKVVNVVDFQRGTAFQMLRDPNKHTGFCVTWTILFIHYRIINTHVPLHVLIRYIHMRITTNKLLQYAKYVESLIKKI
jgi:hypothetical protein